MSSKNRRTTAFGFSSGKFLENRASVFPKMRNTKNREKLRKTQKVIFLLRSTVRFTEVSWFCHFVTQGRASTPDWSSWKTTSSPVFQIPVFLSKIYNNTVTCIVFSRQLAADSLANFRRGQLPTLCTFPCICRQPRTPCKEKPARKTELTVKSIKKRGQTWPNEVKFVDRKVFLSTNLTAFFDSQPEIAADSRGWRYKVEKLATDSQPPWLTVENKQYKLQCYY